MSDDPFDLRLVVPNARDPQSMRRSLMALNKAVARLYQELFGILIHNDTAEILRNTDGDAVRYYVEK